MLPIARVSELHVEQVGDDLVLFDHRTHAAHSLNAAAAFVWERCDGDHSAELIADQARTEGLDLTVEAVRQTIQQLHDKQLLATAAEPRITYGPAPERVRFVLANVQPPPDPAEMSAPLTVMPNRAQDDMVTEPEEETTILNAFPPAVPSQVPGASQRQTLPEASA